MATLEIPNEKVLDLLDQLSNDAKRQALQRLLADPAWDGLLAYGESKLDEQLAKRGLDRSLMTPNEVEDAIRRIADGSTGDA